jgi:hypothetical protein
MMASKKDTRFRGNWSPSVANPNAFAFKFLPTAPAQKPKSKNTPPAEPEIVGMLVCCSSRKRRIESSNLIKAYCCIHLFDQLQLFFSPIFMMKKTHQCL